MVPRSSTNGHGGVGANNIVVIVVFCVAGGPNSDPIGVGTQPSGRRFARSSSTRVAALVE